MAQFSTATFQLHKATAFHCLTQILLSIYIYILILCTQKLAINLNISYKCQQLLRFIVNVYKLLVKNKYQYSIYFYIPMINQQNQQTPNITPNTLSAKQSSIQGDGSIKRKLFSRKPAPNNITFKNAKMKKQNDQENHNLKMASPRPDISITPSLVPQSNIKINMVQRRQRQTQFFYKPNKEDGQMSIQNNKHIFFSPKNQKLLHDNVKTLQTYPPKHINNRLQQTENEENVQGKPNIIKRQSDKLPIDKGANNGFVSTNYRQRTNTLMIPALSYISHKSISKYRNSIQSKAPERQRLNSLIENTMKAQTSQCSYCKNNKEMINIINEKCARLQQKNRQKHKAIEELTQKLSSLESINSQLNNDYLHILVVQEQKDIELFKLKEEFHGKIEALKIELNRVYDRLKYLDIQNNVLLRYKDQYGLITKEFDNKLKENEELKKRLNQNQYQNRYGVQAGVYQTKPHQNAKQIRNGLYYQQTNRQGQNIYHHNIQNSNVYRKQQAVNIHNGSLIQEKSPVNAYIFKQDDQISLTLSQRSYDQY